MATQLKCSYEAEKKVNKKFIVMRNTKVWSSYGYDNMIEGSKAIGAVSAGTVVNATLNRRVTIKNYPSKGDELNRNFYYLPSYGGWMIKKDLTSDGDEGIRLKEYDKSTAKADIDNAKVIQSTLDKKKIEKAKKDKPIPNASGSIDIHEFRDRFSAVDGSLDREEWNHFIRANKMAYQDRNNWHYMFNRMQFANPYYAINQPIEYIFFTKPNLNILKPGGKQLNENLRNDPFWVKMKSEYRRVISDLQEDARRDGNDMDRHVFIPMLTNAVMNNMDLPTITAETTETAATIYGTTIEYRNSSRKSTEGFDFSLEFYDNPWGDLLHFLLMYDKYEDLKSLGIVGPPSEADNLTGTYRINKLLHDQFSVYKFVVSGDDRETLLYWTKATGVYIKNVPLDPFTQPKEGLQTYSVDFHAQFIDAGMNPYTLYDFNKRCIEYFGGDPLSKKVNADYVPMANKRGEANGGWRSHPYIVKHNNSHRQTGTRYALQWYDIPNSKRKENSTKWLR